MPMNVSVMAPMALYMVCLKGALYVYAYVLCSRPTRPHRTGAGGAFLLQKVATVRGPFSMLAS